MTLAQTNEPPPRKPLRLWLGVAAVALQWLAWLLVLLVRNGEEMAAFRLTLTGR